LTFFQPDRDKYLGAVKKVLSIWQMRNILSQELINEAHIQLEKREKEAAKEVERAKPFDTRPLLG
jgi:hypothetical protein